MYCIASKQINYNLSLFIIKSFILDKINILYSTIIIIWNEEWLSYLFWMVRNVNTVCHENCLLPRIIGWVLCLHIIKIPLPSLSQNYFDLVFCLVHHIWLNFVFSCETLSSRKLISIQRYCFKKIFVYTIFFFIYVFFPVWHIMIPRLMEKIMFLEHLLFSEFSFKENLSNNERIPSPFLPMHAFFAFWCDVKLFFYNTKRRWNSIEISFFF